MLKRIIIMLMFTLFIFSCVTKYEPVLKPVSDGYELKGYIPTWSNWTAEDVKGDKLTELIISFALVTTGNYEYSGMISGSKIKDRHFTEIKKLRELYPDLRITVAIGGWGADGFSDAVLTPESREKFTQSIADYLIEKDFDGIDIDWEFPVSGGWGAIKARDEDKENFSEFMILLRKKLDLAGNQKGEYLTLSVAANSGDSYLYEWVDIELVSEIADNIHLMSYDNAGAWSEITEHHTGAGFTEDAVKRFIEAGVPSEKLILGGAFYGKYMTGIDFEGGEPLGAPLTDKTRVRDINYSDIKSYLDKPGFIKGWDDREFVGRSPYIWNGEKGIFITYDDPQSFKDKASIVKEYGLAGAMFWDYTQDNTGDLLGTFSQELLGK